VVCIDLMLKNSITQTGVGQKDGHIGGVFLLSLDSPIQCLHGLKLSISKIRMKYSEAVLLLGGDFNQPDINRTRTTVLYESSRPHKAESELLLSTVADYHMDQLNTEPTTRNNKNYIFV